MVVSVFAAHYFPVNTQVSSLRTKSDLPELSRGSPGFSGSERSATWPAAPSPPFIRARG